jgi:hypothetical protein
LNIAGDRLGMGTWLAFNWTVFIIAGIITSVAVGFGTIVLITDSASVGDVVYFIGATVGSLLIKFGFKMNGKIKAITVGFGTMVPIPSGEVGIGFHFDGICVSTCRELVG